MWNLAYKEKKIISASINTSIALKINFLPSLDNYTSLIKRGLAKSTIWVYFERQLIMGRSNLWG